MTEVSVTLQVADHIRSLRAQRRWSARQLAEVCARVGGTSLTRGTIAKIESGSRKYVTADELTVLAQVFEVSPSALLSAVPGAFESAVPQGDAQGAQAASTSEAGRTATAMRTLPRDVTSFTGRRSELGLLMDKANPRGVVGMCVIDGMAGVGKTAFAVHAAHQLSVRFPDGQVFIPLHGHTPGHKPVDPADALASLLLTAGVDALRIPPDLEARKRLWRAHVAGCRLLMVLDDAVSTDQVRPLLPGTAESLVLITSRRRLSALQDALAISLDTLPPSEAAALLVQMAGRPELSPQDRVVAEIARMCGYLPLAIGMTASQLRRHPTWTPAELAGDLAAGRDRLGFMTSEDLSVAAAFDLSYQNLTPGQQRLFRRLGLLPGTDVDAWTAAALGDADVAEARRDLEALYDQHLLTEPTRGRYRFHELIREHARALAEADPRAARGAINPELVTALDLDQWSDSLNAQSTLPVLVRRLVLAKASVTEIAMRGREGTRLPGWDGLVKATAGDTHVPAGTSGWELGTSKDPRAKAQSDYKARTDDPLGVDPATTTFVAVTSRIWRDRDDWRDARRNDGPWADVRAYDADDLETWLERAPSVHIWISELLGREPRDIKTPNRWWATWSSQTRPVLSRSFLLAGRDGAGSELREALAQSSQVITVVAPSREEALAVICASLVNGSEDVDDLAARTLVASGAGAWDRLVDSDVGLVLIPTFEDPDVQTALGRGHHVVVPVARDVRPRGVAVQVPALDRVKATQALIESAGLDRDLADRYAAHARRSLLSLRRTIAISPAFKRPTWSQASEGSRFAPLLLAGSWRRDSDGDGDAIASLTGRPYTNVEADLAAWSALEDAPLRRSGQTWRVVSKDDAWDLISSLITPADLNRFHEVAVRVLQEPDPALDLSPERRFMAAVVGERRIYSPRLRAGIADTIAFLGGYAGDDRFPNGVTGQEYADRLVWAVTENLNADLTGRVWQSLTDVMPLLAEASPDRFLDAVETGLAGDDPLLRTLFPDSDAVASFGASSPHFALVWALETLCWSPDHLSRAASALARLADIDPDPSGPRHPRPAGSLAQVFNLYWPQTSAPLQRRLAVLDGMRHRSPRARWSLLRAILPAPGFGIPSHRPRWRPWAHDRSDEINPAEVVAGTAEIVTRLLEDAGTDAERWTDLVGHLDSLPISDREKVLADLETLNSDSLGDSGKTSVWQALVDLSGRHRQFADADWAMPSDVVERMEQAAAHFAPASLVDLHASLFDDHPRLPDVDPHDYIGYDGALRAARREAAGAVMDSGGVTDLLTLGATVKVPRAVGWAAAETRGDQLTDELLPLLGTDGPDGQVAYGYAAGRIDADGLDWIKRQLQRSDITWSTAQQAGLLLAVLRPNLPLLAIVAHCPPKVQQAFWAHMNPTLAEPDARPAIARELIERRRPWAAITVLVGLLPTGGAAGATIDVDLVELALDRAATGPSDDAQHAASLAWEAEQLLNYLERVGSDIETRARLEFLFMPLLQHTRPARALGEALKAQPALFVEIMSVVYRAESDPPDEPVPAQRKALAEVGFSALRSWHTPPGVRPDGTVNVDQLRGWISEARRLLAESGRHAVGDIVIGEMLAHVPADSDGLWPALPVRDLIEELASTDLETGLRTGKFNSRGMVTRGALSGGEQERALVVQFGGWAERVADQWPRTGALLRGMSAAYNAWARGEDDRAEDFGERDN